jgi:hypothetical protein
MKSLRMISRRWESGHIIWSGDSLSTRYLKNEEESMNTPQVAAEDSYDEVKYIVIGGGWLGIRAVRAIESISKDSVVTVLEIGSK